jgi:predicted enzyme related to lactoylglutathione lyase
VTSFLSRGSFKVMLGECPDAISAGDLGDHNWFAQVFVDSIDEYHDELVRRGGKILSPLETKSWGIREFSVRTPDGHRIGFAQIL